MSIFNFTKRGWLAAWILLPLAAALNIGGALAQGKNGTTLAAYKTIDICSVDTSTWRYSGIVAIWNEGAVPTEGLTILDRIQNKVGTTWTDGPVALSGPLGVIAPGTTQATAVTFPYSVESAALPGTVRNVASITITNHSGSLGTPKGPEPKATFVGEVKPCPTPGGCTYTQGYWGSKPGVVWPSPYDRGATFYLSGQTWQQVMDTPVNVSQGYYQLAHQYIAAVLNVANGAAVPTGVQTTLDLAEDWLSTHYPSACTGPGSCGQQKDWAAVLDKYNNGVYPGGPQHCE